MHLPPGGSGGTVHGGLPPGGPGGVPVGVAGGLPPQAMPPNGPQPPPPFRQGGMPPPQPGPPNVMMHHGPMPPPHIIPDQPGYRHMPPMMGPPAHHPPPMPQQFPQQQLTLIETLIQLINKRLFIFVHSGIAEKDHAQWWDAFAHEFFDDDAKMTFIIHDDQNTASQKYTIGRTLIPRYFRTVFDGGVKEMFYLIKTTVREIPSQWGPPIFDCDNVLLVTKHDKPVLAEVQTECKLITEVALEEGFGHRFRHWTIEMRHCQEYIIRDMNVLQSAETQERLRSSLTRTGMTAPTINYLKMCIILEPMQMLMSTNKSFNIPCIQMSPRQCLQQTLFDHHTRIQQRQQQQQQQQQQQMAMNMGPAPSHLLPAPPIEEHTSARPTKQRKRTRKGSQSAGGATPTTNSKKKNTASPAPAAPNFPINPHVLQYQDVMVVGEPSMMGGDYGEEDERTISRVVNTQFDPNAMQPPPPHALGGPPGAPAGGPPLQQMPGPPHPFMQVPYDMTGGWVGGPPSGPPPGAVLQQRPGSTNSTPHTPVSRIGTPMGGMPG